MEGASPIIDRFFTESDEDQPDQLGFLDIVQTPGLVQIEKILEEPIAWILGPPWRGKSFVAEAIERYYRTERESTNGVQERYALTRLGDPRSIQTVPPEWWKEWAKDDPRKAVWLIDGVEEALDENDRLFNRILDELNKASDSHLCQLRLILFTRPYFELREFRDKLQTRYAKLCGKAETPRYCLARLHRSAAETLVGPERFAAISELIQRNKLQTVAGFPSVLRFLAQHHIPANLTTAQVWQGVIDALLGEQQTNAQARRFTTQSKDRFDAACRIAAVLSLTRQDVIREYAVDPTVVTLNSLFQNSDNRQNSAAREVCQTIAFAQLPEERAFRFAQRNVQDWFTAFALRSLPISKLRSALEGPDSKLARRFQESARLLRSITDRAEIRVEIDRLSGGILLPSDAAGITLSEAIECLNQLEDLARKAPWGLRLNENATDNLARLSTIGLGSVLDERLRDATRPHQVKELLFKVAIATRATEICDAAVQLILDKAEHDEVRASALGFVIRFGGVSRLRLLENVIGQQYDQSQIERRLAGRVIYELLRLDLWPAWQAALHLPSVEPNLLDHRRIVLDELPARLSLEDARRLLPHLKGLFERHAGDHPSSRFPEFLDKSISLVVQQQSVDVKDIDYLVHFIIDLAENDLTWSTARQIAFRIRHMISARRVLYESDVEKVQSEGANRRLAGWTLLLPDDWEWLLNQARGPWASIQQVWIDAYTIAHTAREKGDVASEKWGEVVRLVEENVPGLPAKFEQGRRQYQLEEQQREAEHKEWENRDPTRRSLADRVDQVLNDGRLSSTGRMQRLGLLCFSSVVGLQAQARGVWDELDSERRKRVLEACQIGLAGGKPTAIPEQGSFPSSILGEGGAFSAVALSCQGFLSEDMIRRWLATSLFSSSGEWHELVRACWSLAPAATEPVLIDAIEDNARRYSEPFKLRMIPSECWTRGMSDRMVNLARSDEVSSTARCELLEQLVNRATDQAEEIAAEWAKLPVSIDDADRLRQGGRNVLLVCQPTTALGLIETDFRQRGAAVMRELSVLWGWRDEFHLQWDRWPVLLVERLGSLLIQAFPPTTDADFKVERHDSDDELRETGNRIVSFLLQQPGSEAQSAVDRLAPLSSHVRDWIETHRTSVQAGRLIPAASSTDSSDPSALSLYEAIKTLDRAGYRLIRSADDLLDAVLESLQKIDRDFGYDWPMLYSRPEKNRLRRHLNEDALQAYVRRRLLSDLPSIVDEVDVWIIPEAEIGHQQKPDFFVTAPCHGTRALAKVVIEVKWSDHGKTRSALTEQLGKRYLRPEKLSHGVFLVGWCGKWTPGEGKGASNNRERLESHLLQQRDGYCSIQNSSGYKMCIEIALLNLAMPKNAKSSTP